jgi:inosose dehydratase
MSAAIEVGNAPVSYGAFERTVGIDDDVPDGASVLDAVAAAGYRGVDLGPLGYLGDVHTLPDALARRQLLLTGAYLEVDVSSAEGRSRGMAELSAMLDLFDVLEQVDAPWRPRPTVAVVDGAPSTALVLRPEAITWESALAVLREISATAARRGYEACLHNEVGTLVADADQVVEAAERSGMRVCVDTGHLLVAGGDPVQLIGRLGDMVHHVHLKDVTRHGLGVMTEEGAVASDVWAKRVFCPLGAGQGGIANVVALLQSAGFTGWVVVEQDVLPQGAAGYKQAAEDQVASRAYLRSLGL